MHTVQEIEKDIFKIEGVKVSLSEGVSNRLFLTKYSEHNPKQINANSDIDELHDRISEYVDADQAIKDQLLKDLLLDKRKEHIKESLLSPSIISSLILSGTIILYFIAQHIW